MTAHSVIVPTVASGEDVDVSEVIAADGVTRERQNLTIGDPNAAANLANVSVNGALQVGGPTILDLLGALLTEMRIQNFYLQTIANSHDEPDTLRNDPSFNLSQGY